MRKLFTIILCALTMQAIAVPAYRGAIAHVLSNGDTVMLYQHGDEYNHWLTDLQGRRVTIEAGQLKQVALTDAQIRTQEQNAQIRRAGARKTPIDLNIAPRGLVILINFKDATFQTDKVEIDSMLNGVNYSRQYTYRDPFTRAQTEVKAFGSARQYFLDQSCYKYQPRFDVVGPYTVSGNMAKYGSNDGGNDTDPWSMVAEACRLADQKGVDFSLYDNDKDGIVDFVYVIYAGYGEADSHIENTVWPHTSTLYEDKIYLDGKRLGTYACGNEINYASKKHNGIGTFCHEFCHVLGLPDLYDTQNQSNPTLGSWDVLAYGPYNNNGDTPPAFSGYERFFMGWSNPTQLMGSGEITMATDVQENCFALLCELTTSGDEQQHNLIGNDPSPMRFYLLEERRKHGWDEYLPGEGLLITKITYNYLKWMNNRVNNGSNQGVSFIKADAKAKDDYDKGLPTDAYPAGANACNKISGYDITNIYWDEDRNIHFTLNNGTTPIIVDDIHDIMESEGISAVYDMMGRKISMETPGVKIVLTKSGKTVVVMN